MTLEAILLAFGMFAAGAHLIEAGGLLEAAGWLLSIAAGVEIAGAIHDTRRA